MVSFAWEDKEALKCGPRANIYIIKNSIFKHKTETRSKISPVKLYILCFLVKGVERKVGTAP